MACAEMKQSVQIIRRTVQEGGTRGKDMQNTLDTQLHIGTSNRQKDIDRKLVVTFGATCGDWTRQRVCVCVCDLVNDNHKRMKTKREKQGAERWARRTMNSANQEQSGKVMVADRKWSCYACFLNFDREFVVGARSKERQKES